MSNCYITKDNFINKLQKRINAIEVLIPSLKQYKKILKKYDGRQYNKTIDNLIKIDGVDVFRKEENPHYLDEKRIYIKFWVKSADYNSNDCCLYLKRYNEKEENFRKIDCDFIFKEVDSRIKGLEVELEDKKKGLEQLDNFLEQSHKLRNILKDWNDKLPDCIQSWNEMGRLSIQITNN